MHCLPRLRQLSTTRARPLIVPQVRALCSRSTGGMLAYTQMQANGIRRFAGTTDTPPNGRMLQLLDIPESLVPQLAPEAKELVHMWYRIQLLQRVSEVRQASDEELRRVKEDEIVVAKEEVVAAKEEILAAKEKVIAAKDEIVAAKDQLQAAKDEAQGKIDALNKRLEDLSKDLRVAFRQSIKSGPVLGRRAFLVFLRSFLRVERVRSAAFSD